MGDGILTDRRVQARLAELQVEIDARAVADLQAVLRTDFGRRFLHRVVFETCQLNTTVFFPGQDQGELPAFRDGRRSVGLRIAAECEAIASDLWDQALLAGRAEERQRTARRMQATEREDLT